MNETAVKYGTLVARNAYGRPPPFLGRGELFGVIPKYLIWNFATVLLVALIFYWLLRSSSKAGETPMDVLKKRYAAGEIDKETFISMKKDIAD